jgi:hypothetical protein
MVYYRIVETKPRFCKNLFQIINERNILLLGQRFVQLSVIYYLRADIVQQREL